MGAESPEQTDTGLLTALNRAIVREATCQVQEVLLDHAVLRRSWPGLVLPDRRRQTWEEHLPDLSQPEADHVQ